MSDGFGGNKCVALLVINLRYGTIVEGLLIICYGPPLFTVVLLSVSNG